MLTIGIEKQHWFSLLYGNNSSGTNLSLRGPVDFNNPYTDVIKLITALIIIVNIHAESKNAESITNLI